MDTGQPTSLVTDRLDPDAKTPAVNPDTVQVADFGLARELQLQTRMETASYGTVSGAAPCSAS